jgi:ribose transport system substrate-binding protein
VEDPAKRWRKLLPDLSINLAGGIVLAGAVKVYSVVTTSVITPSTLWLAGAAMVGFGVLISIVRYRYRRRPAQVFILVSAFAQKHWVNKLLHDLIMALGQHDLDLVFKAPVHDYSGLDQIHQLSRMRRKSCDYAGGFIMVTEAPSVRAELAQFSRRVEYPVVFLDQRPFTDLDQYPRGTAFVGCSSSEIGASAAAWVARNLADRRIRRPVVLVVGSGEHEDRQLSFASTLKQRVPGAVITVNSQGLFVRERCREIVDRQLKELSRRGEHLHAIFCTNDEMALGAVDAIQERIAAGDECDDIAVVGVDGTDEALAVVRSESTPFRATVVQDSRRVADLAVRQLLKLRAGERVAAETFLPTTIYPME